MGLLLVWRFRQKRNEPLRSALITSTRDARAAGDEVSTT
jgi:hypothetical protein